MDLFSDPKYAALAKKFLEKAGETKHSRRPYYNAEYALAAKKVIDAVLQSERPMRIMAKDYSVSSIRLQFFEGRRFLVEKLDTTYSDKAMKVVCRTYEDSIEVRIKRGAVVAPSDDTWKNELLEYIESATEQGAKFHRDNMLLSAEEKDWIANLFADIKDHFMMRIEDTEIHIIRYDE